MFTKTLHRFRALPDSARAMVFLYRVSEHVLDLKAMEKLSGEHSFYPGLVYRDMLIWMGRSLALGLLLFLLCFTTEERTLQIGIAAIILSYCAMYWNARQLQ